MITTTNKQTKKNSTNFIEKNDLGPIKLKLLLNLNAEMKNTSNYSYILRTHSSFTNTNRNNHKNQKQINNRNLSLKIKPTTNVISSSTVLHGKKKFSDNMYNYLKKHSSRISKKGKSIKINSKKDNLTNLLTNKSSKDPLINLLSLNEKTKTRAKTKKNSIKFRINNNICNAMDLKKSFISKNLKTDFYINEEKERILTANKIDPRKNLYDKFENIKLKTGNLLAKYKDLVDDLHIQLKFEKCKTKLNNNYSYKKIFD